MGSKGAVRGEASEEQVGEGKELVKRSKGYESRRDKQGPETHRTLPPMPGLYPEGGPFKFYLEVRQDHIALSRFHTAPCCSAGVCTDHLFMDCPSEAPSEQSVL